MAYFKTYRDYFKKTFMISFNVLLTKPSGLAVLIPIVSFSLMSTMQQVLVLLFWLFVLDFITGIAASHFEKKAFEKANPDAPKTTLISSHKLKYSGVKAFMYCSGILTCYGVEKIFFVKSFRFDRVSDKDLTITVIMAAFFCAIEFYSIFFENFKRCGIDVVAIIKKMLSVKKEITSNE